MGSFGEKNGAWFVRTNPQRLNLVGEICPHCDFKIFPPREGASCPNCGAEGQVTLDMLVAAQSAEETKKAATLAVVISE